MKEALENKIENFIFVSRINGKKTDYDELKKSSGHLRGEVGVDHGNVSHSPEGDILEVDYITNPNILVIHGPELRRYIEKNNENALETINRGTYETLVNTIKDLMDGIIKYTAKKEDVRFRMLELPRFTDGSKTKLCIHWGGPVTKGLETQKVMTDMPGDFPITYFSSTDGEIYQKLVSGERSKIEEALKFYGLRE